MWIQNITKKIVIFNVFLRPLMHIKIFVLEFANDDLPLKFKQKCIYEFRGIISLNFQLYPKNMSTTAANKVIVYYFDFFEINKFINF